MSRRLAILALLALPLSWRTVFTAEEGWLQVDLAKWQGVTVSYKGKQVHLRSEDIFAALEEV